MIEAAGGAVWRGLRIIKRANEQFPVMDLELRILFDPIKGSNIELFFISRNSTVTGT